MVASLGLGCGYRFTAKGASLPENPRAVFVPVMLNRTAEPGAETYFTQALRTQLSRQGTLGGPTSPVRMLGEITAIFSNQALAENVAYRINASVTLKVLNGERLMAQTQISASEDFLQGADILLTESNRQAALVRLSQRMMEDAMSQLSTGW